MTGDGYRRLRGWAVLGAMIALGCSCDSPADDDSTVGDDDTTAPDDDDTTGDDDSSPGDDDDTTPGFWAAGDTARLAAAVGNNVGLYALAACEFSDEVFFTNLHSLGVGVVSADDGALVDVIDLGGVTDDTVPLFPHVACLPATESLAVNDRLAGDVIRIDAATHQVLDVHPVCEQPGFMVTEAISGHLLVACLTTSEIVRLDGQSLAVLQTFDLGDVRPTSFAATPDHLAVVDELRGRLSLFDRSDGALVDQLELDGWPSQIDAWDADTFYLSARESGTVLEIQASEQLEVVGEVAAGSDPFGVTAMPQRQRLYVVARQGADVPDGGTYTGEPGVVYGIDAGAASATEVALVGKTPHFAVHHPGLDTLFVGAEDSLDIAAIAADESLLWTSPPLGLTLDDVAVDTVTGRVWFPSHLSDEVWVYDRAAGTSTPVSAPRWPFAVEIDIDARRVYVAAQQLTHLYAYDADTLEQVQQWDLGFGSHQLPCAPLCAGHFSGVDLALDTARGLAYVSHPPRASVLQLDLLSGDVEELVVAATVEPGMEDFFQHMAVVVEPTSGRVFAYYNLDDRLVALDDGAVVGDVQVDTPASRPLALDLERGRVLIGAQVLDLDLQPVDELAEGTGLMGHAATADRYLAQLDHDLIAVDPDDVGTVSALAVSQLQAPPFMAGEYNLAPLLVYPLNGGELALVVNVFEGAVEVVDPTSWVARPRAP
jgi:DNA-binding beta-propeller fold protein YncE